MSLSLTYCLERVREARQQADAATLENVRETCLRSLTAWEKMAERAQKVEHNRSSRDRTYRPQTDD